jgi:hypothetical protein
MITITLSTQEASTLVLLMQAGVKSQTGQPFDQASAFYHMIRQRLEEASKPSNVVDLRE